MNRQDMSTQSFRLTCQLLKQNTLLATMTMAIKYTPYHTCTIKHYHKTAILSWGNWTYNNMDLTLIYICVHESHLCIVPGLNGPFHGLISS